MRSGKEFTLPKRRKISLMECLDKMTFLWVIVIGLLIYAAIVLLFSLIELGLGTECQFSGKDKVEFPELLYFNFISILTIGYGDLSPKGFFRILTIIEAILGLGTYSLFISVITIKLLLPKKNTIVFSKYAYFCTDDNAFMIIYLNTATQNITNLETSWYFKAGEDWKARSPVRVPFITRSVQTFYLRYMSMDDWIKVLHPYDCLRVGLSGNLGMSSYSTSIEYTLKDILVIPNRNELTKYMGFYQVDSHLNSAEFAEYFHYNPKGAKRLHEYL